MSLRENCKYRNQDNGNCLLIGGFCTSVNDHICPTVNANKIPTIEEIMVAKMYIEDEISKTPYCNELSTLLNVINYYERNYNNIRLNSLIEQAKNKYPVNVYYRGCFSEEDIITLEKECDVHCSSVYMDGSGMYNIRYKKNME